jgi:DNA-binding CsgD family transcriptional regulator
MLAELGSMRGGVTPVPGMAQWNAGALAQSTLDVLPVAIVIVDGEARILHRNVAAAAMLRDGVPIIACQARLKPSCSATASLLRSAIQRVASGMASPPADSSIALPYRDGRVAVAHVRSLSRVGLRNECRAGAAVFVTTPAERAPEPPIVAIAALFALTKTEMRVLQQIVAGRNRREAAAALCVSDATVATHLKGIFAKTGTSDQLSLFRKVAALSWPAN